MNISTNSKRKSRLNFKSMKIKEFFRLLTLHGLFFVLGTLIFISLFHSSLFKSINVFFYRGIILLLTSCVIMTFLQYTFKHIVAKTSFSYRDLILSIVVIFSFNLVFFTHLPVTAERSVSVFMLGYMDSNPNITMNNKEMSNLFYNKYLNEYGEISRRFNEQIVSGNIIQTGDGYKITRQGQFLMKIYRFIASIFAVDKKLVSPTY